MKDLLITWPKKRSLESYLTELEKAATKGQLINFRVPTLPKVECERCYIVYDGKVRGWTRMVDERYRGVEEVIDPVLGGFWPAGNYIVRTPQWHPLENGPEMKGFQGYRYIERPS